MDLRYEFYPKSNAQLFIGAFYKKLQDPIEKSFVSAFSQLVFQPTNVNAATIYGAEIVYSRQFKNIGLTGNYSYTRSKVSAPKKDPLTGINILQERPLQGQADHAFNLSVDYKNPKKNYYLQVAYQYLGKTLTIVYPNSGYDYYRQPQSFLSLSADKNIGKRFTIFGKFNNLLNTPTITFLDQLTTGYDVSKASGTIGIRYSN